LYLKKKLSEAAGICLFPNSINFFLHWVNVALLLLFQDWKLFPCWAFFRTCSCWQITWGPQVLSELEINGMTRSMTALTMICCHSGKEISKRTIQNSIIFWYFSNIYSASFVENSFYSFRNVSYKSNLLLLLWPNAYNHHLNWRVSQKICLCLENEKM
jgi:hypothetical protein